MKTIEGNILQSNVPVIIHQCNCFHKMGSGFAKTLRQKYPCVYESDKNTKYGDKGKLGGFSLAKIQNEPYLKYVFNLYSQYKYGTNKKYTDYCALEEGIAQILYWCQLKGINRVGIPYLIGCGLAGGDKQTVLQILLKVQKQFEQIQIQLYKLENKND